MDNRYLDISENRNDTDDDIKETKKMLKISEKPTTKTEKVSDF